VFKLRPIFPSSDAILLLRYVVHSETNNNILFRDGLVMT
jgi:hypothetical protein